MHDTFELVEQTNEYDCGAAVLAMVLGYSSPADAERLLGRECCADHSDRGLVPSKLGVTGEEMLCALFGASVPALPFIDTRQSGNNAPLQRILDRIRICDSHYLNRHLGAGGAAMLIVPSLNTEYWHWILVSRDRVFDPSRRKRYRVYSDITEILGAILIGEPIDAAGLQRGPPAPYAAAGSVASTVPAQ